MCCDYKSLIFHKRLYITHISYQKFEMEKVKDAINYGAMKWL